jgi:hypothetical protein
MERRTLSVMELEDDDDKVYLVGIQTSDLSEEEREDIVGETRRVLDANLDNAGVVVSPMPVEGMQVAQLDEDEVQDLIDYHNIKEEVNNG